MNNDTIRSALALTEKPYNLWYNSNFRTKIRFIPVRGKYMHLIQTPLQEIQAKFLLLPANQIHLSENQERAQ